jgi:hypothetical protein
VRQEQGGGLQRFQLHERLSLLRNEKHPFYLETEGGRARGH